VLKVLKVDPEKQHVNLSLRRVTEREKRERLLQLKRDRRGERLFKMAAKRLGVDQGEAIEQVGNLLEDRFGSLYAGFEHAAMNGEEALTQANIPSDWAVVLAEIAESRIRIPRKKVRGTLELTCNRPNGVEVLKNAFKKAENVEKTENADIHIYVLGSPRYSIEVSANSYKEAETLLEHAVEAAIETVEASDGVGVFTRR
jgi:translation initiation factor 2 subunit 1